ncbi:MAG: hypothetical protein ABL963_12435 [Longimicrobiales bacterium]
MSLGLLLTIGGAVLALIWGVWLGLPGRYTQSADDIDKALDTGGRTRRTVRKVFTPLAWLTRNARSSSPRRSRRFKVESPKDR